MRTTLVGALVMAVLLTGATAGISLAREPGEQGGPGCHSTAPNESGYGSGALSYRMCQELSSTSGSSDVNSHIAGANSDVSGNSSYATNNR